MKMSCWTYLGQKYTPKTREILKILKAKAKPKVMAPCRNSVHLKYTLYRW